ncbi:MAG: hypothetical protein GEU96_02015 [Propionibacteriales bacterium]|nr:hypothetical protein [Propionibacteriales bacterium]
MPRRTFTDFAALDALLRSGERVATHTDLAALGLAKSTICSWIAPSGRWQRILPGVVLAHRGTPTRRERRIGALRYAGDRAMLTGMSALAEYGVKAATGSAREHVLVPHDCQRNSHSFIVVERTRLRPEPRLSRGLPLAPLPRAVIDSCRREENLDRVRAIVAEVVQSGRCTPREIAEQIRQTARQRSALSRIVMSEIEAGIRSVAEARARDTLRRHGVREPQWNVSLYTKDGAFIGDPDGYYEDVAVAIQIDSMEFHLAPKPYKKTQRRNRSYNRNGILILEIAPGDIAAEPLEFCREVEALLRQGAARPVPQIIVRRRPAQSTG